MHLKLFILSLLSILFAVSTYSCTDKKKGALANADDEKLAQQIARSKNFKEYQKVLKKIRQESRNIIEKTEGFEVYDEQRNKLKANPNYTDRGKKDSIARMEFVKQIKTNTTLELRELMKFSGEMSKKVNEEFPQLNTMAPDRKKSIVVRAMIIDPTYLKLD
ncbi:MAG TPA: hypothetical protein VF602_03365 [Pedobacter sp.]